eukprot:CAMPEP_0170466156 /NCGR_PEP_ID=MMETSP0123-20130129/10225_1 /TAXON_ID=182087 /ORGANISM="Favella ehrenbergii, Strain Fehren 1" /LENGTH=102 /DNA_ID=CAMNT_0010732221 /DNA_START=101 /DNA_END=409 /DNA_ORIENTATION=-
MVEADKDMTASTMPSISQDGRDTRAGLSPDTNFDSGLATAENRHLLAAAPAGGNSHQTCAANYGAMNTSRQSNHDPAEDACNKSILNDTHSEVDSSILDTTS